MTSELFEKYDVRVSAVHQLSDGSGSWHAAPTAAQWTASLQRARTDPSATLSASTFRSASRYILRLQHRHTHPRTVAVYHVLRRSRDVSVQLRCLRFASEGSRKCTLVAVCAPLRRGAGASGGCTSRRAQSDQRLGRSGPRVTGSAQLRARRARGAAQNPSPSGPLRPAGEAPRSDWAQAREDAVHQMRQLLGGRERRCTATKVHLREPSLAKRRHQLHVHSRAREGRGRCTPANRP